MCWFGQFICSKKRGERSGKGGGGDVYLRQFFEAMYLGLEQARVAVETYNFLPVEPGILICRFYFAKVALSFVLLCDT